LLFDDFERAVTDPLGGALFTPLHHIVDELGQFHIVVQRIRGDHPDYSTSSSGHR
jgi:hypothetical protein